MTTPGVALWLEEQVAAELNTLGLPPFKGVLRQTTPDYRPEVGVVLYGTREIPFISVSSVLAETSRVGAGTNVDAMWVRPVTVVLVASKQVVEKDDSLYKRYRETAMRQLLLNRFRGNITGITGACVFQATVRPKSAVELSAWVSLGKWVSAFDVLIETREPVL
ncbi:MAG: hypothetical protein E6Q97_30080 [Desulfurellales bacterium]|nr:MAG: hypothetical protein E6Q97_30080 [Desulfurellales bacterium]